MAYCSNCGKKMSDFAQECPHCHGKSEGIKKEQISYEGALKKELISTLIACLLIMPIAYIYQWISFNYVGRVFGYNALEALGACHWAISPFLCMIVAMVIFLLISVISHFVLLKMGNKKVVRIGLFIVGIIIYTTILVLLSSRAKQIPGRDDLHQMIEMIRNNMGIYYGLVFGSIIFALIQSISNKKIILTIIEVILSFIVFWVYSALFLTLRLNLGLMFNIVGASVIFLVFMLFGVFSIVFRGNK